MSNRNWQYKCHLKEQIGRYTALIDREIIRLEDPQYRNHQMLNRYELLRQQAFTELKNSYGGVNE